MKRLFAVLLLLCSYAVSQTVNANILPATTGLDVGSPNQQWDGYFRNITVSGTSSFAVVNNTANDGGVASALGPYIANLVVGNNSTTGSGYKVNGTFTTSLGSSADLGAFVVSTSGGYFPSAFHSKQGAAINGLLLDPQASGAGQPSQQIQLAANDASSGQDTTTLYTAPDGTFVVSNSKANVGMNINGPVQSSGTANIRFASGFSGANCGAKINAADTDLGSPAGEIWVNTNCGTTISTAVSLSARHTLRFVQGGIYLLSAAITLGAGASIVGLPSGTIADTGTGPVILKAANGAFLANMIVGSSGYNTIRDVTLDGNQAGFGTTGANLALSTAGRFFIFNVTSKNANTHGISVTNSQGVLSNVFAVANKGDGLYLSNSPDMFIVTSQFENNTQYGIEASDSPTARVVQCDVGGNTLDGIYAYGTNAGLSSGGWIVNGTQFGNQKQRDIYLKGWDSGGGATANVNNWSITGNAFNGSSQLSANNTWSFIVMEDDGQNTVTGNTFKSSASSNQNKYAVEIRETSSGRSIRSTVTANTVNSLIGTSFYSDTSTNKSFLAGNYQATGYSQIGPNIYHPNGDYLNWIDNNGNAQPVIGMGSGVDGSIYIKGQPNTKVINLQPNPGTTALTINDTSAQFTVPVTAQGVGIVSGNAAAPTCSSSVRGQFWYVPGGAGVKDVVEVCAKDAADVYAWRSIY